MPELGMAFLNPLIAQGQEQRAEAKAPFELAHLQALSRLGTAQAGKAEYDLEAEKKYSAVLAQRLGSGQPSDGTPQSYSELLSQQAADMAAAGKGMEAAKVLEQAARVHNSEVTNSIRNVEAADKQAKTRMALYSKGINFIQGVNNEDSWKQFNELWKQTTGKPSPWDGTQYDPQLVKAIQGSLVSANQRLLDEARKAREKELERHDKATEGLHAADTKIRQQRLELARQREERIAKTGGGKDVGAPTKSAIDAAGKLVGKEDLDEDSRSDAAFAVASRAQGIRKMNPGVTEDEALARAYGEMKGAGEFTPGKPGGLFGFGKEAGKFNAASPLPASQKDLVDGKAYVSKGRVMVWNGKTKQWMAPAASTPTGRASPPPEEDDEDEED